MDSLSAINQCISSSYDRTSFKPIWSPNSNALVIRRLYYDDKTDPSTKYSEVILLDVIRPPTETDPFPHAGPTAYKIADICSHWGSCSMSRKRIEPVEYPEIIQPLE